MILSFLPRVEILLDQCTSRAWRRVVSDSPRLQRILFLLPEWKLEGRYADEKPGPRPANNLMLRKVMGGTYPTLSLQLFTYDTWEEFDVARKENCQSSATDDLPGERDIDGKVDDGTTLKEDRDRFGFWAWNVNLSFPACTPLSEHNCKPAVSYPAASWRRMFMSQPPPTSLHLTKKWQRTPEPILTIDHGITMQDLVNATNQSHSQWSETYINSDEDWHLEGPMKYDRFWRNPKVHN